MTTKILMLIEHNPYPQDNRARREATTLTNAGYQVSVIAQSRKGQPWHETLAGVQIYRYPAPPGGQGFLTYVVEYGYSIVAAWLLSLLVLFRHGFHIIHGHNPPDMFVLIALFYRLFGKLYVFDHRDLSPEMYLVRFAGKGNRRVHQALLLLEKLSCQIAHGVIAVNQSYRRIHIERDGVPAERIVVVRNGPDLSDLTPPGTPAPEIRRPGKLTIAFVGVMGYQDRLDNLLEALHHLTNDFKRTDFICVMMGSGAALPDLKALTQQLALTDYVHFTGWIPYEQVLSNLSAVDICVAPDPSNPYNDRSTLIKLTEYMAAGKPVVAFDLPEHRFTAQDAALYASSDDPCELARQILALMDNPAQRAEMGQIGRRRIETELAWPFQEAPLLNLYERLSAQHRGLHFWRKQT